MNKIWKTCFKSLVVSSAVVAASSQAVSCSFFGIFDEPTFVDFKRHAKDEAVKKIVDQLGIDTWSTKDDSMYSKSDMVIGVNYVRYVIKNITREEKVTATAQYSTGVDYNIKNWKKFNDVSDYVDKNFNEFKDETEANDPVATWQLLSSAAAHNHVLKNINIDFRYYDQSSLVAKPSSNFTDDKKNEIDMHIVLGLKDNSKDFSYTITLKILWNKVKKYDIYSQWIYNYSFNNWKSEVNELYNKEFFKEWSISQSKFSKSYSEVGPINFSNDSANFRINNWTANYFVRFDTKLRIFKNKSGKSVVRLFAYAGFENEWTNGGQVESTWNQYYRDAHNQTSTNSGVIDVLLNIHKLGYKLPDKWYAYINISEKAREHFHLSAFSINRTAQTIYCVFDNDLLKTDFKVKSPQVNNKPFNINDFVPDTDS